MVMGKASKALPFLTFHHSVILHATPIKSVLTFFKLLKPAFQLGCIQELISMGCWEQQGLASPGLDMSSVNCWQWAIPPKRLPLVALKIERTNGQCWELCGRGDLRAVDHHGPLGFAKRNDRTGPFTAARSKVRSGMWTMLVTPGRSRRVNKPI